MSKREPRPESRPEAKRPLFGDAGAAGGSLGAFPSRAGQDVARLRPEGL